MSQQKYYPQLNSKISFPEMEKEMIAYWEEKQILGYPNAGNPVAMMNRR